MNGERLGVLIVPINDEQVVVIAVGVHPTPHLQGIYHLGTPLRVLNADLRHVAHPGNGKNLAADGLHDQEGCVALVAHIEDAVNVKQMDKIAAGSQQGEVVDGAYVQVIVDDALQHVGPKSGHIQRRSNAVKLVRLRAVVAQGHVPFCVAKTHVIGNAPVGFALVPEGLVLQKTLFFQHGQIGHFRKVAAFHRRFAESRGVIVLHHKIGRAGGKISLEGRTVGQGGFHFGGVTDLDARVSGFHGIAKGKSAGVVDAVVLHQYRRSGRHPRCRMHKHHRIVPGKGPWRQRIPGIGQGVVQLTLGGGVFGPGLVKVGGKPYAHPAGIVGIELGKINSHRQGVCCSGGKNLGAENGGEFVQAANVLHPAFPPQAAAVVVQAIGFFLREINKVGATQLDLTLPAQPRPGKAPGIGHLVANFPKVNAKRSRVAQQGLPLGLPVGAAGVAKKDKVSSFLRAAVAVVHDHL